MIRIKRLRSPRATKQNPKVQPALNATTKPFARPLSLSMQLYAVLILAVTATFIPTHPLKMEVKTPVKNALTVQKLPVGSSTNNAIKTLKIKQKTIKILYSSTKKVVAPSATLFLMSHI